MATDSRRAKEEARKRAAKRAAEDRRRRVAGASAGAGSRVVAGVELTAEQYRSYQELNRSDPASGEAYLNLVGGTSGALPEITTRGPGPKYGPKVPTGAPEAELQRTATTQAALGKSEAGAGKHTVGGLKVSDDQYYAYKHLNGKDPEAAKIYLNAIKANPGNPSAADAVLASIRSGTKFAKASGAASIKGEEAQRQAVATASGPLPTLQELGLTPSLRTGSATEQFLTAAGTPVNPKGAGGTANLAGAAPAVLAMGPQVSADSKIWLSGTGTGIATPARGHMVDPDAPGGRLAGRETTQYSTINQYYIKLWQMPPGDVAAFQRAQGITPSGTVDGATEDAWKKVLERAARLTAAGQMISPDTLMGTKMPGDTTGGRGGLAGPGEAGGGPKTTTQISLTNRGEAKKLLNSIFRLKLGRGVTEDEVSMFQASLNAREKTTPTTKIGELSASGSQETSSISGGMNPEQYAEDYMMNTMGGQVNARMVGVDYLDAALKAIGAAV